MMLKLFYYAVIFTIGNLGFVGATHAQSNPQRPNILFVLCDDLRYDVFGYTGDHTISTPAIDNLANQGARFDNAFVTTPICAISRVSFFTGQYAIRHGANDFTTSLPDTDRAYFSLAQDAGYQIGFIGKWGVDARNYEYVSGISEKFDYWGGAMMQSSYFHERDCNYVKHSGWENRSDFRCDCPEDVWLRQGVGKGPGPHPALEDPIHETTEVVPGKFRDFVEGRNADQPFLMSISLKAPHGPFSGYPASLDDVAKGMSLPKRPNVTPAAAERMPQFVKESLESDRGWAMAHGGQEGLIRQYYRLVKGIDLGLAELRNILEEYDLSDNTIVIFTSDHGHMKGEHGLFGKWLLYEESIRIPLIIFDPRLESPTAVSKALALNIDLAPTMLSYAGVSIPDYMQGLDLSSVVTGQSAGLRDDFYIEHVYEHSPKPPLHIEPSEGVRSKDWKYIHYYNRQGPENEQLYHLATDPYELQDLSNDPSHDTQLKKMRARYSELKAVAAGG